MYSQPEFLKHSSYIQTCFPVLCLFLSIFLVYHWNNLRETRLLSIFLIYAAKNHFRYHSGPRAGDRGMQTRKSSIDRIVSMLLSNLEYRLNMIDLHL